MTGTIGLFTDKVWHSTIKRSSAVMFGLHVTSTNGMPSVGKGPPAVKLGLQADVTLLSDDTFVWEDVLLELHEDEFNGLHAAVSENKNIIELINVKRTDNKAW